MLYGQQSSDYFGIYFFMLVDGLCFVVGVWNVGNMDILG